VASRIFGIIGALFLLLGLAALIHPRIEMPAQKTEVEIHSHKVLLETRRIVTVPWMVGGVLALGGAAMIFLGTRAAPETAPPKRRGQ
jgi:hypothetical protein